MYCVLLNTTLLKLTHIPRYDRVLYKLGTQPIGVPSMNSFLSVHMSVLSLLKPADFLRYMILGTWPSFRTLLHRGRRLGAYKVQVLVLRGWTEDSFKKSNNVIALEPSWGTTGISGMLFDKNSDSILRKVALYRQFHELPRIPTIDIKEDDGSWAPDTLIEIAGGSDRQEVLSAAVEGRHCSHRLVYDTHHVRELLTGSTREEWMLPLWQVLLGKESKKTLEYAQSAHFREGYEKLLREQFDHLIPKVEIIQIQTRSKQEAKSIFTDKGAPSILRYQLSLIAEFFDEYKGHRNSIPIIIEIPFWWPDAFKEQFINSVMEILS